MLRRRRSTRRSGERGQTLLLALAFIALFGLFVASILYFGSVALLQHSHAEATAIQDSLAEGGAAYALSDAARSPAADCIGDGYDPQRNPTPTPNVYGSLSMADHSSSPTDPANSVVKYEVNDCNPGGSSNQPISGTPCLLCVLGQVATNNCQSQGNVRPYLCDNQTLTVKGDIDVNGSVGGNGTITSSGNGFSPAALNVLAGNACVGSTVCTPGTTTYPTAIPDPLAGMLPTPSGLSSGACPGQSPATPPCTKGGTLSPGIYAGLSGNNSYTLNPGVYVFTGAVSLSGNASISGTGLVMYLACSSYPTPCPSTGTKGRTGGSLSLSGSSKSTLAGPTASTCSSTPTVCPYATNGGVLLFADPFLIGTGLSDQGNGDSLTGTIDMPSADISVGGGGSKGSTNINGRVIANSVSSQTGQANTGLVVSGTLTSGTSSCTVYDDSVHGFLNGGSGRTGRAIIQANCGGRSGVVALNYAP